LAIPAAYGSSWARDQIRATAAVYTTAAATADLSHICDLHHHLQQHWILHPENKARNQTHIFTDAMSGS